MTGIVKSAGCKVCKQRRVKCDETTPQCLRCQKIGRDCPGPDPQFQVVQQQRQIVRQENQSCNKKTSNQDSSPFLVKQQKRSEDGGLYQTLEILSGSSRLEKRPATATSYRLQTTEAGRLSSLLVDSMNRNQEGQGLSISALGDFFTFIPSRIGYNRALDAVVSCLIQGHQSLARQWPADERNQLEDAYLRALRNLQLSLDDPNERSSAETLCGALVLAVYEIFRPKGPGEIQWLAHAGGAAAILRARGPDAFTTNFEQSLLLAHHESVVSWSIFQGSPCYLNSDTWLSALHRSLNDLSLTNTNVYADKLFHSTLYAIGTLPQLIHRLRARNPETSPADRRALSRMAQEFRSRILALAQIHEAEFFDGKTVLQKTFNSSTPNIKKPQTLFPPPLRKWPADINLNPYSEDGSQYSSHAVQERDQPEFLASAVRVDYSSRYAARRHLLYWTAVILSNILLLRLEGEDNSANVNCDQQAYCWKDTVDNYCEPKGMGSSAYVPGHMGDTSPPTRYPAQYTELNRARTPTSTGTHVQGANTAKFVGQSQDNIIWYRCKQSKNSMTDPQLQHVVDDSQVGPNLTPLIPEPILRNASSSTNPLTDQSSVPLGFQSPFSDIASQQQLFRENMMTPMLWTQNPQLPSPPEELPPTESSIDYRILSQQPIRDYTDNLNVPTTASPRNHLTPYPYYPCTDNSPSSPFTDQPYPPPGFLTSRTISPHTQNLYLHALILRSLPYAALSAPLGAIYILFPFQMAAAISTPEQKTWIANALTELFGELHLKFSRDKTWTAPTFMDDVDRIARDAGVFWGEWQR